MDLFCTNLLTIAFGGSYMSLFNTISNLGHNMYVSPFLSLIDVTSKRECVL